MLACCSSLNPSLPPSLLILLPTPNQLPLLPHHQPCLLLLLPLNRLLQLRVVPCQVPKRSIDHVPQFIDLRVVLRSGVRFSILSLLARTGAAWEGERLRRRVGRPCWEVRVPGFGGLGDGGVVAGECCSGHRGWRGLGPRSLPVLGRL